VKIVCLVKQVPRADSIEFDQETKQLRREGVPLNLNPFDAAAVTHAAAHEGAEVIAMTMGPPQAEEALRTCLALGAKRCIHLSDRVFAVADTLGTARTLALAIQKEGDVDLVVCGRKTTDSETWQVPPETAAFLGWPHLTSVAESEARNGRLRATRETDAGYETWELAGPAVISVAYGEEASGSADGPVDVWTARDLVDDVRENDKRFGQTGSPTRVLAVRDVTPARAGIRVETVTDAVAKVRALLAERPTGATEWEKPARLGEKPGKSYDSWTFVETIDGRPSRPSLELVAKGRELAGKLGGENVALVFGHELDRVAETLGRYGAERVVLVDDQRLETYQSELWSAALVHALRKYRPHVLTIPATANGRDVGPRAAGELELGMTGDCVNLGIDRAGRLIQTKPAYGGNIVSIIMGATTPQLATVRPRMFAPLEPRDSAAEIERFEVNELPSPRAQLVERRLEPAHDLDEADVVVLLGPDAPDLQAVEGVAIGATREVCAAGKLPRNRQIGLYGRPVAPRVLVAVGVPGDFEQLTGIVKAAVIVAVNSGAEMEAGADVVVRGDADGVISALAGER
jgi:electron transfer flavoprotein alpha subunit